MGSIPIVKYENTHSEFTDLPILFISDWKEVTKELLDKKYDEIINSEWNLEKLKISFWKNFIKKKLTMEIKIFCTHYSKLKNRKENINNIFKDYKMPVEFVETYELGKDLLENPHSITDTELSIWMKHLDILNRIIDRNLDYAFVIEDDLYIDFEINLEDFFKKIIEEKENSDIIFFGGCFNFVVPNPTPDKIVYIGHNSSRCAHGYFVTRKFAEIVTKFPNFEKPYDHALNKYILDYNLVCAWTHPFLKQSTVERLEISSIINQLR